MATGGREEQAMVPASRGLLGVVGRPVRAVGLVLEWSGVSDAPTPLRRFGTWRKAGRVFGLIVAAADALVVTGLVVFDLSRMALAIGRVVARVVPA